MTKKTSLKGPTTNWFRLNWLKDKFGIDVEESNRNRAYLHKICIDETRKGISKILKKNEKDIITELTDFTWPKHIEIYQAIIKEKEPSVDFFNSFISKFHNPSKKTNQIKTPKKGVVCKFFEGEAFKLKSEYPKNSFLNEIDVEHLDVYLSSGLKSIYSTYLNLKNNLEKSELLNRLPELLKPKKGHTSPFGKKSTAYQKLTTPFTSYAEAKTGLDEFNELSNRLSQKEKTKLAFDLYKLQKEYAEHETIRDKVVTYFTEYTNISKEEGYTALKNVPEEQLSFILNIVEKGQDSSKEFISPILRYLHTEYTLVKGEGGKASELLEKEVYDVLNEMKDLTLPLRDLAISLLLSYEIERDYQAEARATETKEEKYNSNN